MLIGPVVAPAGTTAVSWPKETPLMLVAVTPWKRTTGVPTLKLAPVMVTLLPIGPAPGKKPKMVGGTTKLLVVVKEPAGVLTRTGPVLAPMGTVTLREVLFVAGPTIPERPLNSTSVAPKRFMPVSVTFVLARPAPGENPVT